MWALQLISSLSHFYLVLAPVSRITRTRKASELSPTLWVRAAVGSQMALFQPSLLSPLLAHQFVAGAGSRSGDKRLHAGATCLIPLAAVASIFVFLLDLRVFLRAEGLSTAIETYWREFRKGKGRDPM